MTCDTNASCKVRVFTKFTLHEVQRIEVGEIPVFQQLDGKPRRYPLYFRLTSWRRSDAEVFK
jgi:hypothetical protein